MGAKAKTAIAKAERAAASMTYLVGKMKSHFDNMYKFKSACINSQIALAEYVKATYPKETDLRSRIRQDPKLFDLATTVSADKNRVKIETDACRQALDGFTDQEDKIVDAIDQLTALINAKRTKRNKAVSGNVIKKLIAKAKTKSLDDLVEEKQKLIAVINQIGPIVDQIKADPNFRAAD